MLVEVGLEGGLDHVRPLAVVVAVGPLALLEPRAPRGGLRVALSNVGAMGPHVVDHTTNHRVILGHAPELLVLVEVGLEGGLDHTVPPPVVDLARRRQHGGPVVLPDVALVADVVAPPRPQRRRVPRLALRDAPQEGLQAGLLVVEVRRPTGPLQSLEDPVLEAVASLAGRLHVDVGGPPRLVLSVPPLLVEGLAGVGEAALGRAGGDVGVPVDDVAHHVAPIRPHQVGALGAPAARRERRRCALARGLCARGRHGVLDETHVLTRAE